MTQVARWCFTNYAIPETYDPESSDEPPIPLPGEAKFGICQVERCPDTGRLHVQGYIVLPRSCRLATLKKIPGYETAHWEPAKGSTGDNVRYCSKVETRVAGPFRVGEEDVTGRGARSDLVNLKRALDDGKTDREIAELDFGAFLRFGPGIQRYRAISSTPRPHDRETPLTVVLGKSGLGKTRWVFSEAPKVFVKALDSKWWDGFDGLQPVLVDDFVGGLPFGELLRLANSGPYSVECKGGRINWNPSQFFITSNIRPDRWYRKAGLNLEPLLRRISRVVYFFGYREYIEWKSDDGFPGDPDAVGAFSKFLGSDFAHEFLNYQVVEIDRQ